MASEKPFRNTTARTTRIASVTQNLVLAKDLVEKRVLDGVLGGVGRRQRHRDDEVRRGEPEQHQDQRFPFQPARRFSSRAIDPCPA